MAESASSSFELDARLHVTASEHGQVRQFPIGLPTVEGMELVIGRSRSVDLTIHDDYISNRHLKIIFRGGEHWLEDLASTHGTLLNEKPVKKPVALKTGDLVTLGKSKFEYRCTRRPLEDVGSIADFADTPPPEKFDENATQHTGTLPTSVTNGGPKASSAAAAKAAAMGEPKPAVKPVAATTKPVATAPVPGAAPKAQAGGAGFATMALAFLGVAAILALVCYLAWQVFFAGKG
jgi:hypothetical protein